ncbi:MULTISPECIES: NAD(P)/FAD-dependent oxidoreductase [unclassified Lentimonas]|uniref:phytoene desaturase family protein n=1 Tax=unclassified Lentimonas TaxID=2630993 RepID=UPI001325C094|nr:MULTISPECIES: FAD-dependent oxidoreductase [unclassified Lentimonas]CAA6676754.1 probable phytoene dehydrogenase [Lentimonas sp. CC4]CAA6684581.1 probable phytoene dehydrogenase [Lentimonas sp. CC6]CAA7170602.1 probable phytoene dehydrogenase [Lentimonas sp. CC21]CAA7183190.1 probable phytoene dehydrogenase [Lentimonas sp. CC8]
MKPSDLDNQHFETVIIGAGMAGMAAGIRLALAGKHVIILERHNASGGLNSFYSIEGRKYDVGLHAMTNFVPKGTKGTPLTKLLRQLRIPYDALDLCQQNGSRIAFPGAELEFSNDFALFETEVARAFPKQIDGFRALAEEVRTLDAFNLGAIPTSARAAVQRHISDPLLEDMIFCPVMYYGSAEEHDMDYGQFSIMFRSLFFEGFARPFDGVRVIIKLLQDKYRSLGGIRKMKCGIKQIHTNGNKASAIELDNGAVLTADKIISTAGVVETTRMCADQPADAASENIGQLSFTETITALNKQPAEFGWDDTIIFFNTRERFHYAGVHDELVDPTSGVICFPNNYQYGDGRQLDEGFLRITAMANHDQWCALSPADYLAQKAHWYAELQKVALGILPAPKNGLSLDDARIASDMFTPRTVRKFTGHLQGAIYGAPNKIKDGRTHLDNLYLAGTDQGFLGIIGAMLSGISMANLHVLQGD